MSWTSPCELDELEEDQGKYVEIGGFHLAVFLHEGQPYALSDECPHAGAPMAGGWIDGDCVVCPRHCWQFHLADGKLPGGAEGLMTYPVRVIDFQGRRMVQADLKMP